MTQRRVLQHQTSQLDASRTERRQSSTCAQQLWKVRDDVLEGTQAVQEDRRRICSLSRQQLEEVRSLVQPPPTVRHVLAIVYCLLFPEDVQTGLSISAGDAGEGSEKPFGSCSNDAKPRPSPRIRHDTSPTLTLRRDMPAPTKLKRRGLAAVDSVAPISKIDDIPWHGKLAPMLRRGDLIQRILDFPPEDSSHPLLQYPEIKHLILQRLSPSTAGLGSQTQQHMTLPHLIHPKRRPKKHQPGSAAALRGASRLLCRSHEEDNLTEMRLQLVRF